MCGIAGFVGPASRSEPELRGLAERMAAALPYRGPDDWGAWADGATGVGLGHRRLSIVDLSPAGHQPMTCADGSGVISYNGEVYNADELRAELGRHGAGPFRGHSDTEVLAEFCARFGVAETASRLIGMFAFAWWDKRTRTLSLVRDRLGIKPVYWARIGQTIAFASELKAFFALPEFKPEIDRGAQAAFLRFAYVPAPRAIYRDVFKLEPGTVLTVGPDGETSTRKFWDARAVALQPKPPRDPVEAEAALHDLLKDAVTRRMVADVPLGAFLSGGVDSSTVVALMQSASSRPVRTFTIGFNEESFDEAPHARAVAKHLGTEHTELILDAARARDVIPRLPDIYDEPFADASAIPTFLVSELTRRHVTVALSGDGGDELFAGYNRYIWAERIWRRLGPVPPPVRAAVGRMMESVPVAFWDAAASLIPRGRRPAQVGDKVKKLAAILDRARPDDIYRRLVNFWESPGSLLGPTDEPASPIDDPSLARDIPAFVARMRYLDLITYLPDDILAKVDRASMAVSLEARVPLLDHRVVEFVWRLPPDLLIRDGSTKWLLRRVLDRYVPRSLIERPKTGFGVPIGDWMRGPLRAWAEDLLSEKSLHGADIPHAEPVRTKWRQHLGGRQNWAHELWTVLMWVSWHRRWMQSLGRPE
ncbi:MAG TPA: asparagine synthase (glutamine-hydrolyzing) [Alphaproteobacteria bacterium]|nr:asparagine synthase (glutamine-hydrolyzing) [Alphaproteobacteria bacterium]